MLVKRNETFIMYDDEPTYVVRSKTTNKAR